MQPPEGQSTNRPPPPEKGPVRGVPVSAEAAGGPLTEAHQLELMLANQRARKIRRAARVAAFNGWVTGILAGCAAPFIVFGMTNLLIAGALAFIAYNEFRGRKLLLQFNPSAAKLLGWNQIGLLGLIVVYCLWMIYASFAGSSELVSQLTVPPEAADALGTADIEQLFRVIVLAMYGLVIVLSAIFQGLNALYYFTRRKYIEAYLRETPDWVVDVQRVAGSV